MYPIQSIYFRNAAIAGGIAIACGVMNPVGSLGYLAAVISGSIGGVFAHSLGKTAYDSYNKWCHRVCAPLLFDDIAKKTPAYDALCLQAFEKLKSQDADLYQEFKQICQYDTDEAAFQSLTSERGCCTGFTRELVRISLENPNLSSTDLLKSVNLIEVFYYQLIRNMLGDVQYQKNTIEMQLEKWQKLKAEEKLDSDQKLFAPYIENNAIVREKEAINMIGRIIPILWPWTEFESSIFSLESPHSLQMHFKMYPPTQMMIGRIVGKLYGECNGREYAGTGHQIFFQCILGKWRFYNQNGGLFEYEETSEFCEALRTQLVAALSREKTAKETIKAQFYVVLPS